METFAEFMAESFRSNVSLTWNLLHSHSAGRNQATASFTIDNVKVIVSFEQREANGPWHVLFEVDKGDKTDTQLVYLAFSIFNGVFQAVEEFGGVREPETLLFATRREELSGIYQTYLRRESATLEKLVYRLEGPEQVEPYRQFLLKRVRPSAWRS
jgi:hypothetical protein